MMSPSMLARHHSFRKIPIDLGTLSSGGCFGVAADTIVETIWAITKFIYTDDEEVEVIRYHIISRSEQEPLDSLVSGYTRLLYQVHRGLSPAQIATDVRVISSTVLPPLKAEERTAVTDFAQTVRLAECLTTGAECLEHFPIDNSSVSQDVSAVGVQPKYRVADVH